MSMLVIAAGAGLFALGAGIGTALTLALARDKITAMTRAAEEASTLIASQSDGALRDLAAAHARAEQLIGAIEAAKLSSAKAEESVTALMANIAESRAEIERVTGLAWFQKNAGAPRLPVLRPPLRLSQADAAE
jgi:NAD(P)-dependent dehydrogenase (short-subunit alcohol dehydrogenase family)